MSRKIYISVFLLVISAMVLSACASEPVVETVVVTQEVVVTEEVEVVVTQEVIVTEEVEVIVEATPVAGRCAPMSVDDVETIKIGATLPQSAPGSVVGGLAMQTAFNIAVDEINSGGGILGKDVDVIFYDTASLPERGTAAMEYLITQECVAAVVGEYHSSAGVAMKEVSKKYHIPTVFAETWNDTITGVGYEEVFRIAPASSIVAAVDANYLEALGLEYVVIVTENSDYGIPAAEATTEQLAAKGIESDTFSADIGTQDFAPVIARIQAGQTPEAVLVLLTGETSYNFEQQAAEAGLMPTAETICIANQVAINSEEFWTNVPDGNYCSFRKVGLVPSLANDVTLAFEEKYRERFDRFPESYALEAYDSLMLMANAIETAGSLDPDEIIAALEATDITLAQGRYHFPYGTQNPVPADQPDWMWHQWPDVAVLFIQYFEEGQSADDAAVVWPPQYQTHDTLLIPFGESP